MDHQGLLLCARYALPPNSLHYCGPDKITNLFSYTKEQIADNGLLEILSKFQTLYPYLALIAGENNLRDPFDPRVVEAYWLGNRLLNNVSMKGFYRYLIDTLEIKKKISGKDFEFLTGKIPIGAIPYHTFHVLNIFIRTGHHAIKHTLETMDNCRISWGKVIIQSLKLKNKKNTTIQVLTKPLVMQNNKLVLGKPIIKEIECFYLGLHVTRYTLHEKWISFHWNQFCDFLTPPQVANLEKYTQIAINLANKTI